MKRRLRPAARPAFTLIELLVVVAILIILAGIAMPNLLEAQARAKVSRAAADMRSLAAAIEAYAVDWNSYPPAQMTDGTLENRYRHLTTPQAYITAVPQDPFGDSVGESLTASPYRYRVYDYVSDVDESHESMFFERTDGFGLRQVVSPTAHWFTSSQGPDAFSNFEPEDPARYYITYDPTNGTVSVGDIYRIGPG